MHVWHCDITYDITASFNYVTLVNKMTRFRCTMSEACLPKIAQNNHKKMSNAAMVHPECRVFRVMPHPPHIFGNIPMTRAYNRFIYPLQLL